MTTQGTNDTGGVIGHRREGGAMPLLSLVLGIDWIVLMVYTLAVVAGNGLDFVTPFVSDIAAVGWPGQFNLDLLMFILLAAMWVAWREKFHAAGIGIAALVLAGGCGVFLLYLLVASLRAGGDVHRLLTGNAGPSRA